MAESNTTSHNTSPQGYELARMSLEGYIENPGHDEVLSAFGVALPTDPIQRLDTMKTVAAAAWDARLWSGGVERQDVNWETVLRDNREKQIAAWHSLSGITKLSQPEWLQVFDELGVEGSKTWETVFSGAKQLGQVESSLPIEQHPAYLAVLGGASTSVYDRFTYALQSVKDFGVLVYLGSSRPLQPREQEAKMLYAPKAVDEFELGCGAVEALFKDSARLMVDEDHGQQGDSWKSRIYAITHNGSKTSAVMLSTPQFIQSENEEKPQRATTYDNLGYFGLMSRIDEHPDTSVVVVTNAFYTLGQRLAAVQMLTLPYRTRVEAVGYSVEYSGGRRIPTQLLQEGKAGIDAAERLRHALSVSKPQ